MRHSILRRSWMPDTLESEEGILLGIRRGHSESVRSGKGEPLCQFHLCDLARKRGQAGRIEFFWKKSIHLSAPVHKRFFETFLEGIRL